jgi:hypothetical protein
VEAATVEALADGVTSVGLHRFDLADALELVRAV